jgi:hypothetical protein
MSVGRAPDQPAHQLTQGVKADEDHNRNRQRRQSPNDAFGYMVKRVPKRAEINVHIGQMRCGELSTGLRVAWPASIMS